MEQREHLSSLFTPILRQPCSSYSTRIPKSN